LEERRTQGVYTRRSSQPGSADDLGALDSSAIERVRDEVRPDPRDADELHDVLLTTGFFTAAEAAADPEGWLDRLIETRRAARINLTRSAGLESCATGIAVWVAAERLPEILAVHPNATIEGQATAPPSRALRAWTRADAIVELLRGRLTVVGPTTAGALGTSLSIPQDEATAALIALESEGAILRGSFTAGAPALEWCDRRLLARIHRYTLNRLRAEIDPVSPADFMRFLFAWQHVAPSSRLTGTDGLRSVIGTLDGFELAASAWERAVLPARVDRYEPSMLDMLCLAGDVGWARLSVPTPTEAAAVGRLGGTTPIALFLREHGDVWQTLRHSGDGRDAATAVDSIRQYSRHKEKDPDPFSGLALGAGARKVLAALRARGASFLRELAAACAMDDRDTASALGELVAAGLVTSDGFAGLRAIVRASSGRSPVGGGRASSAGRWSLLRRDDQNAPREPAIEAQAWALLRRYGVVFRRLLTREANAAPWRELARTYRRLEARGEIRGGRFVSGMSGEQFALPDAVDTLREIRRTPADGRLITISAADPLNATGIITVGERVRAIETSRIVYRDGVPMAALQGDYLRPLAPIAEAIAADVASALAGRRMPAVTGGFVGA
jgi:ATP-dependent Lhr-like helicase